MNVEQQRWVLSTMVTSARQKMAIHVWRGQTWAHTAIQIMPSPVMATLLRLPVTTVVMLVVFTDVPGASKPKHQTHGDTVMCQCAVSKVSHLVMCLSVRP